MDSSLQVFNNEDYGTIRALKVDMVQMMTTRPDGKANDPYAHMTRKGLDYCMRTYCAQKAV